MKRIQWLERFCLLCGKQFSFRPSPSRRTRGRFCSKSCSAKHNSVRHGHTKGRWSRTYTSWVNMVARCTSPASPKYSTYGAAGITVCDRWLKFENFLADMGERPEGKTIDRLDNDGNYEPGNCEWRTAKQQQRNRRNTVYLTVNGETRSLAEWAEMSQLTGALIRWRQRMGWPEHLWLSKPVGPGRRVKKELSLTK